MAILQVHDGAIDFPFLLQGSSTRENTSALCGFPLIAWFVSHFMAVSTWPLSSGAAPVEYAVGRVCQHLLADSNDRDDRDFPPNVLARATPDLVVSGSAPWRRPGQHGCPRAGKCPQAFPCQRVPSWSERDHSHSPNADVFGFRDRHFPRTCHVPRRPFAFPGDLINSSDSLQETVGEA